MINIKYVSVTGTAGTFYSANYPSAYPSSYEEQYSISVEDGSTISLYFFYFDIEYHAASCLYDHIKGKLRTSLKWLTVAISLKWQIVHGGDS